jgi:cell division protein FtsB
MNKRTLIGALALMLALAAVLAACGGKSVEQLTKESQKLEEELAQLDPSNAKDAAKMAKLAAETLKLAAELEKAEAKAAGKPAKAASGGGGKAAPASDFSYDMSKDGKGVVITKYTGKGGKVVIPGEIEGLPVVELKYDSFTAKDYDSPGADLTAVVIPASVKLIGDQVFYNCKKLTSVTIQGSGVSLTNNPFRGCSELTELVFPDGENTLIPGDFLGGRAFEGCEKLPLAMRAKLRAMGFTEI